MYQTCGVVSVIKVIFKKGHLIIIVPASLSSELTPHDLLVSM